MQAAADADTTLLLRRSQAAVYISADNLDAVFLAADIADHLKLECARPASRLGKQVKQLQVQLREQCAANDASDRAPQAAAGDATPAPQVRPLLFFCARCRWCNTCAI